MQEMEILVKLGLEEYKSTNINHEIPRDDSHITEVHTSQDMLPEPNFENPFINHEEDRIEAPEDNIFVENNVEPSIEVMDNIFPEFDDPVEVGDPMEISTQKQLQGNVTVGLEEIDISQHVFHDDYPMLGGTPVDEPRSDKKKVILI